MKLFAAVLALVQASAVQDRVDIILGHLDRLADATLTAGDAKDDRYVAKIQSWAARIVAANGDRDAECDAAEEEADDKLVFSEDDYCQLNSQINAALNSAARRWACDGRGNVARQAVRRLRKVKNQYARRYCSADEGADARRYGRPQYY
ncbi:Oidioi.mRNA.OKI2018_I69.chr2.g5424.t1.cds [Oikopleura dioica]|uniref:Oidioi.mRNA.OKI2018_I69.chr2.g5424.t1.cds n=1 Tax=Oikopleura dioica TaxID=34765 RepID=A0ABN7T020_OIKDI|nr:Oidioi.mRNA.OKI2018_I69.chr2.g5424.t1.cds [Oikopleura dioica]